MSNKFSGKKYFKWLGEHHGRIGNIYSIIGMEGMGWPEWARWAYKDAANTVYLAKMYKKFDRSGMGARSINPISGE